jgi:ABC-type dipeptide/oligopeptide/nickel transport system permease subunit
VSSAGCAAALATVMALPVAILAIRYDGRLRHILERSTYLVLAIPGLVIALSLAYFSESYAGFQQELRRRPLVPDGTDAGAGADLRHHAVPGATYGAAQRPATALVAVAAGCWAAQSSMISGPAYLSRTLAYHGQGR